MKKEVNSINSNGNFKRNFRRGLVIAMLVIVLVFSSAIAFAESDRTAHSRTVLSDNSASDQSNNVDNLVQTQTVASVSTTNGASTRNSLDYNAETNTDPKNNNSTNETEDKWDFSHDFGNSQNDTNSTNSTFNAGREADNGIYYGNLTDNFTNDNRTNFTDIHNETAYYENNTSGNVTTNEIENETIIDHNYKSNNNENNNATENITTNFKEDSSNNRGNSDLENVTENTTQNITVNAVSNSQAISNSQTNGNSLRQPFFERIWKWITS